MPPQSNRPKTEDWLELVGSLLSNGVAALFYLAVLICLIAGSV